ncbi:hypothetical protein [Nocardioides iriomotensis]|uniref:Uncharacterized protein n=1 Tax=Nocardioides iriomotensis TaxID=715784 RepID=A0A4V1Z2C0_9ACTN|nr:hypothetical protein [Nocardioides iriomotensis]RYU13876.1 hypothetical protein ETU37_04945 [Nocardioides iriomotensis]
MTDGGPIQDEITRAEAARSEARGLAARLTAAQGHAAEARHRADEQASRFADEERDVAQLESMSWVRIWATLRGGRATDLEREAAERDAARYAAAEAAHRATMAEGDVRAIEAQLNALGDVDGDLARALDAKEAWLREHPGAASTRLVEIATRRGELAAEDKENREAHAAGVAAHDALAAALDVLASAASWSTWDTFGGGGLLTDMMKYNRLEQAQQLVRAANDAMAHFATELADVGVEGVRGVEIDGLVRTFDIWFDNIFSDMSVRSRIHEARDRLHEAMSAVRRIGTDLAAAKRRIDDEVTSLDAEREALVRAA